jgi:septum formation inhibitor-activating ATPase MinD
MKDLKRITIISGHYGSGKTNIAVNLAIDIKKSFDKVAVADLDIVNPYFRTKDSISDFEKNGIRLISSEYAGSNVDIPALPQEMYAITDDRSYKMIVDLGGDDRGALALGRLTPEIVAENDYEMLLVVNKFRPLTPDLETTVEVAREIETAGKIKFTGVINNSNLGEFTTESDVLDSLSYANEIANCMGIPVKFTSVKADLYEKLKNKIENLYPLVLQAKI